MEQTVLESGFISGKQYIQTLGFGIRWIKSTRLFPIVHTIVSNSHIVTIS